MNCGAVSFFGNILEDGIGITDPSWRKISNLASMALLLAAWGGVRFFLSGRSMLSNKALPLLLDVPVWLCSGTLMRNAIHPYTQSKLQGAKEFLATFLLAWAWMGILWFLPAQFPSLQSDIHGIGINLMKSPLVLLISIAFLVGFFMVTLVKLCPVARKQTRASLAAFFRGDSGSSLQIILEGIKKILFPSIPA